ncbi:MAG: Ig-like domain-containing protein, partial [Clostridia bacterium]|nr:Ig-like domain-containing protein [Clostridia bacterium]
TFIFSAFICACGGQDLQVSITTENVELDLLEYKFLKTEITPTPDTETEIIWASSDEEVVSVTSTGKIQGLKLGTATITATVGDATDTCSVTVSLPADASPQILLKSGIYQNATLKVGDSVDIVSLITYKDKEYDDASWVYSCSNTSVAEIIDGKIIAKTAGQTEITAKPTWKGIENDNFKQTVTVNVKNFDKQTSLLFSETDYVNTYGRTYVEQNALVLDHSGTAIEFEFYGTQLAISTKLVQGEAVAVRIFIDGDNQGIFTKITNTSFQNITLAENLSNTAHKARIVKASPQDIGVFSIRNIYAESFAKTTAKSNLLIEFVGDSITVGYSILDNGQGSQNVNNTDVTKTYAYTIAKNLNADFSFVCTQGIAVNTTPYLGTSMIQLYKWYSANNKVGYTHPKSPDVVVINLGTNDGTYLANNPSHNLSTDFYMLLNLIRGKHDDAYIILTYGMMSVNSTVLSAINSAIDDFDDEKVSFVTPASPSGEGGHPNQAVNDKTAEILTEYIKNLLA